MRRAVNVAGNLRTGGNYRNHSLSVGLHDTSRAAGKKGHDMKNTHAFCKAGFTLVEIMIAVAITGLLMAIAIPNYVRARGVSQANACINNLRQIDAAANQFALEQHKRTGQGISFPTDLTPYIKLNAGNQIPVCPSGGNYTCSTVGNAPICDLSDSTTPAHVLE